jgi:hypothetical protein
LPKEQAQKTTTVLFRFFLASLLVHFSEILLIIELTATATSSQKALRELLESSQRAVSFPAKYSSVEFLSIQSFNII